VKSAEFGEFDAIIASAQNIYLIESKWDNISRPEKEAIALKEKQELRHRVFSWYLMHWKRKYSKNWQRFVREHEKNFQKEFQGKPIARTGLLVANLEFVLSKLNQQCMGFSSANNIKNVLLFFRRDKKSGFPFRIGSIFEPIILEYGEEMAGNFISLDSKT